MVVSIAVVTTAGVAIGRGQGPKAAYEPTTYEPPAKVPGPPTPEKGKAVFEAKGCAGCHATDGSPRIGPSMHGRWGRPIMLGNGVTVTFDEAYVRESLLAPRAKAQAGYPPSMPSFDGVMKDKEIRALIEYLKTL